MFGIDPQDRIIFHFIKRISKLCSVWYIFKSKLPKSELNIWVGSFWTNVPPPTLKNDGGIRVVAPDDLSDAKTKFENFYKTSNYPLHFFLPVSSWSKVVPKCCTKSY